VHLAQCEIAEPETQFRGDVGIGELFERDIDIQPDGLGAGLEGTPPAILVGAICTAMTFMTELTSNTATTEMILPILASIGVAAQTNPLLLMIPATLSTSCAFMMPVATPPNAIVFGSGRVRMSQMIRAGLLINLIGIVVITLLFLTLGFAVFDIDPSVAPPWAGAAPK